MTALFLKLANMSIAAGWLILAVLVLRLLLHKAPKWTYMLLWGIVGLRLVLPFRIESVFCLIPSAETIRPEIMMSAKPAIQSGIRTVDGIVNPVLEKSFAPGLGASANPLQIWLPVMAAVWCAGVVLLLGYAVVSYVRLYRRVSTAVLLQDCVFQSENIGSAFILGIVRPKIYLPFALPEEALGPVLAHERAHLRRRDYWWKPVGFLLLAVYWLNPLVWVSFWLLCRDIELACDESVIRDMGKQERVGYSQALLQCSVGRKTVGVCPLAFGETGVKLRVKSVLNYKKPAFWLILSAVAACAAVAVCFLTSPRRGGELSFVDLNRNGIGEELRLSGDDEWQTVEIYENGARIFYEEGAYVHMGWNALFLCTLEGKDYLLRYNPTMNQGSGVYSYALFSLEGGHETVIKSNEVTVDLNFGYFYPEFKEKDPYFGLPSHEFDPDAIAAFMEEVNGYLAHSRQLLNTDEELIATFERTGRLEDDLWFLDHSMWGHQYVRDNTKSLLENLREFKKVMETP